MKTRMEVTGHFIKMAEELRAYKLIETDEVFNFAKKCMIAAGTEESHAVDLATLLLAADTRGHFSHGINRLGMFSESFLHPFCANRLVTGPYL